MYILLLCLMRLKLMMLIMTKTFTSKTYCRFLLMASSASWRLRELTTLRVDHTTTWLVRELSSLRVGNPRVGTSTSSQSYLLTIWFGFDLATYFNLWCRRMFLQFFGDSQPWVATRYCRDVSSICLRCMLSIILLLYISNLWRAFSKCSYRQHSAYFHSELYPLFRRKKSASNFP